MYSNTKSAYFKYQKNDVLSLSKAEVVDRLLKALLTNIEKACVAMESGQIAKKGEAISRAIAIAGELQASLNFEEGGEIAENLNSLYDYIIRELLFANLKNDIERIKKLQDVVIPIIEAWSEISVKQKQNISNHDIQKEQPKQLQAAL